MNDNVIVSTHHFRVLNRSIHSTMLRQNLKHCIHVLCVFGAFEESRELLLFHLVLFEECVFLLLLDVLLVHISLNLIHFIKFQFDNPGAE